MSDVETPERLTESEWEMLRLRRECSAGGHQPKIFALGALSGLCLCGSVAWSGLWTKKAGSE